MWIWLWQDPHRKEEGIVNEVFNACLKQCIPLITACLCAHGIFGYTATIND